MSISANEKTIYWQSMLEKWKDSGLSQMAFSMHEGIDSRRLAYWKKALIARGLFTDRVSVSKIAKSKEPADKNPEEPKWFWSHLDLHHSQTTVCQRLSPRMAVCKNQDDF